MKEKRGHYEKHYKVKCFRLNEETVQSLEKLRGNTTWNRFFKSIADEKLNKSCYFCGSHINLEIHHIIALKDGGSDEQSNKMSLCPSCHKKTDNWGNKKSKL